MQIRILECCINMHACASCLGLTGIAERMRTFYMLTFYSICASSSSKTKHIRQWHVMTTNMIKFIQSIFVTKSLCCYLVWRVLLFVFLDIVKFKCMLNSRLHVLCHADMHVICQSIRWQVYLQAEIKEGNAQFFPACPRRRCTSQSWFYQAQLTFFPPFQFTSDGFICSSHGVLCSIINLFHTHLGKKSYLMFYLTESWEVPLRSRLPLLSSTHTLSVCLSLSFLSVSLYHEGLLLSCCCYSVAFLVLFCFLCVSPHMWKWRDFILASREAESLLALGLACKESHKMFN